MKLHVGNVPLDATEDDLRKHFSSCGGVAEVELLTDPQTRKPRGIARVTMTSPHYAEQALAKLDGVAFGTAVLRVSDTPIRGDQAPKPTVKIMQQFKERGKMVYDVDCAGSPLTLRIGHDEQGWHVEARSTEQTDAIIASAIAETGVASLAEALRQWNAAAVTTTRKAVDADAIAKAMRDVKAI